MREPDALDSVRVLAIVFLCLAGISKAAEKIPAEAVNLALQSCFWVVPIAYARVTRLGAGPACGFRRLPWRKIVLVLAASLGSMWLLKGLLDLQAGIWERLGVDVADEQRQIGRHIEQAKGHGNLFMLAALALLPAFCEETFFRGLLLRGFVRSFGPVKALIYSTLLFAAIHQKVVQAGAMLVVGLYFGVLVLWTGSLWAGVLAHFVNNLAVLVVTTAFGAGVEGMKSPLLTILSAGVFGMAMTGLYLDRDYFFVNCPSDDSRKNPD